MLWLDITIFLVSIGLLILAADLAVRMMSKLAGYLRINEYILAFALMAIATSIPELFVGINSALAGTGSLALGNVIGANILNLTLVIGIPILITGGIKLTSKVEKKDSLYMFILVALPAILMLIGNKIGRIDALILIIAFFMYGWQTIKARGAFHKKAQSTRLSRRGVVSNSMGLVACIVLLHFSSNMSVRYATSISETLSVPPIFIGLFIISIGTTLPELMVGFSAARSGHDDIVMGDIIGSVVTNATLVIGVSAMINPIKADFLLFIISTGFMLLAAFLFSTFAETGDKLYQKQGVALIMLYILFLVVELNLKGFF